MKCITSEQYKNAFFSPHETEVSSKIILSDPDDFALPKRAPNAHKYTFGRALVIGGSTGYSGAPVLAALACERSGAGVTTLFVPESIYSIAAVKCDGAVVAPAAADCRGCFSAEGIKDILTVLEKADACLIGPGIRTDDNPSAVVREVVKNSPCPVIIDADAITVVGKYPEILESARVPVILTPHEGEFARISGDLQEGRLAAAEKFSKNHENTVLILKGCGTVIADGKVLYVNPTGNPGMAKGGSGDVLAGVLCALAAQGFDPVTAAKYAAYIHGLAGDIACREAGEYSVTPSDIIANIPDAIKSITK